MEWKIAATTFALIFIAELGDKTQLLVFARSAETSAPLSVFIGAAAALVMSTLLGVLVGGAVSRLPEWILKSVAGTVMIVMGLWTLSGLLKLGGGSHVHP